MTRHPKEWLYATKRLQPNLGETELDESEWKLVHEPKSFSETYRNLQAELEEHAPHMTSDGEAIFLRDVRHEGALDMFAEARKAYQSNNENHAWYFLAKAAQAIGFLAASQGAVYPREDDGDVRSSLRTNGSKGGRAKGDNAQKVLDGIAQTILSKQHPKGGWTKNSMRKEYNTITATMDDYKDADRKWRVLLKRDDIQAVLIAIEPD